MFKFGFSDGENLEGYVIDNKLKIEGNNVKGNENDEENIKLTWFPAVEIKITDDQLFRKFSDKDYTIITAFKNINLKLIRSENVVLNLKKDEHENIIKAESQHSDLLPAIYEGGLKVWECSYDLGRYFLSQNISFENSTVLDLGCGTGIIGILALLKGSIVHFQDYNAEVIKLITIPNVLINLQDQQLVQTKAEFYAGDWETLPKLLAKKYPNENHKYDIILTSETIYNSYNHQKLYEVFKQRLKKNGVGYIAGKAHYFGVGGNMGQFENLIKEDNVFNVDDVWRSEEGLQRKILKLTHRLNK